jgi:hypothetical protein
MNLALILQWAWMKTILMRFAESAGIFADDVAVDC